MNKRLLLSLLILTFLIFSMGCKKKEEVIEEPENIITEINYDDLSVKQLEVLALENDGEAAYRLGLIYDYGLNDVPQNFADSFKWYQISSDASFGKGSLYLGYSYLNGTGTDKDISKAEELFSKALDEGCKEGYVGLARCILDSEDESRYPEAKDYVEKAYNANLLDGYYYMGYFFEKGIGMQTDSFEETENMEDSEELESSKAAIEVEPDYEKAVECYEKVLESATDDINDQFAINSANTRLGYLYVNGLVGEEADTKTALTYLNNAADNGFLEAKYYLGIMYLTGVGVDRDAEKALSYFEDAAEKDYAPALSQIAYIYFNGKGVDADYVQAVYYEKLAAAQGYTPSQINLGYLYENGFGVEKNLETALAYYKLAFDSGYEGAEEAITRVESQLSK